jgi:elongation factor P hydroxylase
VSATATPVIVAMAPGRPDAEALEQLFSELFRASCATVLEGGADEPEYLPARGPGQLARIRYRHDYVASALHEVAHWCIAGARRRRLPDYGYWYAPEGRDAAGQRAFEAVEVRPQALEALFAEAAGLPFVVSLDNPGRTDVDPAAFTVAVAAERLRLRRDGLPPRAALFRQALSLRFGLATASASGP